MYPLGGEDMSLDQPVQRRERGRAGTDLVGERRQADLHALAGIAVALTVERLVRAELLEQDHRQEARAEQPARRRMEWCGGLGHRLARAAGEPLAHGLDHLPLPRDNLERLGHVLAEPRQPVRSAAGATGRTGNDDPLARQMRRQRLARGSRTQERLDGGADRGALAQSLILASARFQLLQTKLELIDQQLPPFGTLPVQCAPHLLVLQLEQRHAGRQIGVDRLGAGSFGRGFQERRAKRRDIAGGRCRHGPRIAENRREPGFLGHPAACGRHLVRGLRQSIASSRHAICDAVIATTPSVADGQMKRPRSSRFA